jgi:GntR family transcriptional regulator
VLKGYQQLVDEGLVEKKRGRGMFVNEGARASLLKDERQYFLDTEWPKIYATITRLGFTTSELMKQGAQSAPVSQPFPTQINAGDEDDSNN